MTETTGRCCGSPFNCGAHDPDRYREGCLWPRPVIRTAIKRSAVLLGDAAGGHQPADPQIAKEAHT